MMNPSEAMAAPPMSSVVVRPLSATKRGDVDSGMLSGRSSVSGVDSKKRAVIKLRSSTRESLEKQLHTMRSSGTVNVGNVKYIQTADDEFHAHVEVAVNAMDVDQWRDKHIRFIQSFARRYLMRVAYIPLLLEYRENARESEAQNKRERIAKNQAISRLQSAIRRLFCQSAIMYVRDIVEELRATMTRKIFRHHYVLWCEAIIVLQKMSRRRITRRFELKPPVPFVPLAQYSDVPVPNRPSSPEAISKSDSSTYSSVRNPPKADFPSEMLVPAPTHTLLGLNAPPTSPDVEIAAQIVQKAQEMIAAEERKRQEAIEQEERRRKEEEARRKAEEEREKEEAEARRRRREMEELERKARLEAEALERAEREAIERVQREAEAKRKEEEALIAKKAEEQRLEAEQAAEYERLKARLQYEEEEKRKQTEAQMREMEERKRQEEERKRLEEEHRKQDEERERQELIRKAEAARKKREELLDRELKRQQAELAAAEQQVGPLRSEPWVERGVQADHLATKAQRQQQYQKPQLDAPTPAVLDPRSEMEQQFVGEPQIPSPDVEIYDDWEALSKNNKRDAGVDIRPESIEYASAHGDLTENMLELEGDTLRARMLLVELKMAEALMKKAQYRARRPHGKLSAADERNFLRNEARRLVDTQLNVPSDIAKYGTENAHPPDINPPKYRSPRVSGSPHRRLNTLMKPKNNDYTTFNNHIPGEDGLTKAAKLEVEIKMRLQHVRGWTCI